MLASSQLQPDSDPSKGGQIGLETFADVEPSSEIYSSPELSAEAPKASCTDYAKLQQRIIIATLIVSTFVVSISAILFDLKIASSLLVGAMSGILYLRLLARSVGNLGKNSNTVSKVQLLVPVVLVLSVSRLPQLELLPVLLGFLLYKPSIILQSIFES